jgi:transcription initiation factor TFIIIB Brf1 subunit/transcription initiation factor TFIIB
MESLFNLRKNISVIKEDIFDNWDDPDTSKKCTDIDADTCPHCFNVDCFDMSELVTCRECGYIISRPFDNTAEYRYFSSEDRGADPTRVGAPQDPRLPEASLGTVILNGYGTAKAMYKVRKYHSWNTVPYKERSFIQTSERLSLIALNSGINQSIIEESKNLYVTLQDIGGRQGLSRDAILSACLYMSLKQSGSPRKPKDIADIFGLNSSTFTKALKQMQEIMALARQKGLLNNATSNKPSQSSTKAIEYIQLPLSKLSIPRTQMEHLHMLCKRIAEKSEEIGLSQENMPPSLAAGCVAFVIKRCDSLDIPLTKIAEASEISLATLQKCLRRLESYSDVLEEVL